MTKPDPIGLTFVSDNYDNSMDEFWMIVSPGVLLSPFDFVNVENINDTITIGIVKEIKRVRLSNKKLSRVLRHSSLSQKPDHKSKKISGVTVGRIDVIATFPTDVYKTGKSSKEMDPKLARKRVKAPIVNMPVEEGKTVYFASSDEVKIALGMPEMERPIPAGLITMTNDIKIPIDLDVTYIFGPDTTHVNATGISGNMKTSYLLFLLQVIHQKLIDEGISIIIFNTKEKDLLYLDKEREGGQNHHDDQSTFDLMGVEFSPFKNVSYFLPRGKDGKANSARVITDNNARTYSYELSDVYDRLDLLFSSESLMDQYHNLSSILNYIYETWPQIPQKNNTQKKKSSQFMNWSDLIDYADYPEEIITHKSTLLKFQGMLQRFYKPSTLFVDKKITSTYLGREIRNMSSNQVIVIDIAMLPTMEEQAFVVGDVLKTINEMYSLGVNNNDTVSSKEVLTSNNSQYDNKMEIASKKIKESGKIHINKKPKYVVILLDEVNRFLPHRDLDGNSYSNHIGSRSSVGEELFKTILAGRSRHCILFTAQQFKSQIDPIINENTGLHILAKLGNSELSTRPYNMVDDMTKSVINKLHKGEFVLVHSAFRHPIKITIPKPAFKKP